MSGQDKSSDDAVWREIVANYGDRPVVDTPAQAEPTEPSEPSEHGVPAQQSEPAELAEVGWHEERFVPPPPPPLPRVPKDRLAAWLGVFVSPVVLLVATVLRIPLPTFVSWLLIGAFLGGFGYLVAQMPRGPRDPFDDGARL